MLDRRRLCYTRENMDRDVLLAILWNPSVMRESLATLRRLRDQAGTTMFYGHDPAQWEDTPRAPAAVASGPPRLRGLRPRQPAARRPLDNASWAHRTSRQPYGPSGPGR